MSDPTDGPGSESDIPPRRRSVLLLTLGALLVLALAAAPFLIGGDHTDSARPSAASPGSSTDAGIGAPSASPSTAPSSTAGSPPASGSVVPGGLATVPVDEVTPQPAIGLSDVADFGSGVAVEITAIEEVQGEARGPGEIAGPALRVRLLLRNDTQAALDVDALVVGLTTGAERLPAASLSGPGARSFSGKVAPGRSARGAYVFAVPDREDDGPVEVTVSATHPRPVIVFRGTPG